MFRSHPKVVIGVVLLGTALTVAAVRVIDGSPKEVPVERFDVAYEIKTKETNSDLRGYEKPGITGPKITVSG